MAKSAALSFAKTEDLLHFAQMSLGLDVTESTPRADLIAKIAATGAKTVPVSETEPSQAAAPAKAAAKTAPNGKPKTVTVVIAKQTNVPGGDEDVPLGVNMKFMLVRRGIPQELPLPYFEVLEKAVQDIYEPLENGGISSVPNKVPLYPYTVIHQAV